MSDGTTAAVAAAEAAEASASAAEAAGAAAEAATTEEQSAPAAEAPAAEAIVASASAAVALANQTAAAAELEAAEITSRRIVELQEWQKQVSGEISSLKENQAALASQLPALGERLSSIQLLLERPTATVETTTETPEGAVQTVRVESEGEDHPEVPTEQQERARHRFL